ncbi:MAG: thiamine ABC transporter substrate-binding protein [Anaerolineae bacterium]
MTVVLWLVACTAAPATPVPGTSPAAPQKLVLMSHDSFAASEAVIQQFEQEHNVTIEFLKAGDAGEALNKACLSKSNPLADVFFGVDNTFLSRALACDIFEPYASPALANIPAALRLDPQNRLLPVDFGYVNLNYDRAWFATKNIPVPQSLEDLTQPAYKGLLVTPNPATSSPGLAFLLATIAHFGESGDYTYLDFWRDLRANDLLVTDGWSDAYFSQFTVGSGGEGTRPLVVSYSTSPAADVFYSEGAKTEPDSGNISPNGATFQQIEFVGVLKGSQQPALAQQFVDFLLSQTFQQDIPLQMFVYPANQQAALPELFVQFAATPDAPATLDPAAIETNRERWIDVWTDAVLR